MPLLELNNFEYWPELNKPHLILQDIQPIIDQLSENQRVEQQILGRSFLDKPVCALTIGHGNQKILAWTQMHGDEPTATAAILDLLSHLLSNTASISLDEFCASFTFKVIPMLNPDGADARTRNNAQGIDINRDAVALHSPEGRILKQAVDTFKPDIAFNLHDQSPYYTVGKTAKPATIAFLAPAYNAQNAVNLKRKRAMQLIASMHCALKPFIEGGIARYNDEYSFRSFGDNIARLGASTILIESGAHPDDPNRQIARKMNVISIMRCFELLSSNQVERFSEADYFAIPENTENGLGDILIRNANMTMQDSAQYFQADIMLKRRKSPDLTSYIDAIGDLSHLYGFQEIDGNPLVLTAGKPFVLKQPMILDNERYVTLLREGYTHFSGDARLLKNQSYLPCLTLDSNKQHCLMPDNRSFMLIYTEQTPYMAILDNFLFQL